MKKILVIDDSPNNLLLIKYVLKKEFKDSVILTALSGKEGIQLAQKELPDTILLDILMPEMNGFMACKILKSHDLTKQIPILIVSALGGNTSDRIEGLNAGAEAFIAKPFDNIELVSQVKVMLRIKEAEDLLRKQNENLEIFIKQKIKEFNTDENRFLEITAYALEYFWEVDSKGKFTYISTVIEKILDYKKEEVIDIKYLFDFPKNSKEKTKKTFVDTFNDRNNYKEFEILCSNKKGRQIWLAVSGFPMYDKDSNFLGYRGVTQDITPRRQAEEDLKKSLSKIKTYQVRLKKLNSELILAEEKERRRIAEYLHDGIGQLLSISHINLSFLQSKKLAPDVQKIILESSKLLSTAIVQSRSLTYDLSPPILYELGLIPAIKWKLDQINNNNNITATVQGEETKLDLHNDTRILLYRIICELLINVIKHAKANLVEVQISKNQKKYYFAVIDNGIGFDYKLESKLTQKGGQGLFSIHERLDSIQGSLIIESKAQKGTKAIVSIPIKKN